MCLRTHLHLGKLQEVTYEKDMEPSVKAMNTKMEQYGSATFFSKVNAPNKKLHSI